ncbi:MAG: acylphosphatase [Candidatus Anstonellaceae archaeon]
MENSPKAFRIFVYGRVQGVFFRAWAREQAKKLSLVGWAKNLPDGSVEIFVQGKSQDLEKFLFSCLEGPPAAKVLKLVIQPSTTNQNINSFEILY